MLKYLIYPYLLIRLCQLNATPKLCKDCDSLGVGNLLFEINCFIAYASETKHFFYIATEIRRFLVAFDTTFRN